MWYLQGEKSDLSYCMGKLQGENQILAVTVVLLLGGKVRFYLFLMIFIEQDLIPKKDKGAYNHV
jgi:hypothetical protein